VSTHEGHTMTVTATSPPPGSRRTGRWWTSLPIQVLVGMALGILLGLVVPGVASQLKVLGDIFLDLLKAGIAPLVFLTLVSGITKAGNLGEASKIGVFALVYFEVISTIGLFFGLLAANLVPLGAGASSLADLTDASSVPSDDGPHGFVDFVTGIVPDSFVGAFTSGQLLEVVIIALIFGIGLLTLPARMQERVNGGMEVISQAFFGFVNIVMRLAPIGAFGAIAYAVGTSGTDLLASLAQLIVQYWIVVALFFFGVFGCVLALAGVNIWRLVRYLRLEVGLTLSTGSSESALPGILDKLPRLGISRQTVGLVVPTGYAFNLDGTSLYMPVCTLFLANAYGVPMGLPEQLALVGIMMLTSKGAATVNGGTFVVFAATVTATGILPTAGLPILFGVYQFMSRATATVNTFGNVVAAIVVGRLTRQVDKGTLDAVLAGRTAPLPPADADRPTANAAH
jgi:aerobic C4-dicarboxylate transport protein